MSLRYDELVAGNCFGEINLATPAVAPSLAMKTDEPSKMAEQKSVLDICKEFNCSLLELFDLARGFLKEKQQTQSINIKYDDNLQFVALSKQAKLGKWNPTYTANVGFLDVIGSNRKKAWVALGEMSKETAMEEFIKLLFIRCPLFEKHLQENQEKDRLRREDEIRRTIENEQILHLARIEDQKKKYEDFQRKQIQQALNQQTYSQFKAYAEQHYKDNHKAQEELIRQLQEEHFQQYLRQVYQQQILHQQEQYRATQMEQQQLSPENSTTPVVSSFTLTAPISTIQLPPLGPAPVQLPPVIHPLPPTSTIPSQSKVNGPAEQIIQSFIPPQNQFETLSINTPLEPISSVCSSSPVNGSTQQETATLTPVQLNNETDSVPIVNEGSVVVPPTMENNNNGTDTANDSSDAGKSDIPNLALANMWTRKDMKEFKDQLRKEKDAVIKIGSGETVTVRVPTHEDGRCIFWEFTTDYYDLGFGVYFEWSKSPSNTVTVHVSDSSEEDEEGEDGNNPEKKDIEKGASGSTNKPPKPRQDEIVPICRRDCHEEIYAGSHSYPGEGIYLLKFDNSYSLWRSKTLYYRVYYSK